MWSSRSAIGLALVTHNIGSPRLVLFAAFFLALRDSYSGYPVLIQFNDFLFRVGLVTSPQNTALVTSSTAFYDKTKLLTMVLW